MGFFCRTTEKLQLKIENYGLKASLDQVCLFQALTFDLVSSENLSLFSNDSSCQIIVARQATAKLLLDYSGA